MSKPTTIQLTFDTPELAEEWRGWYLHGGGDDKFLAGLTDYCDIQDTSNGITHRITT